MPSSFPGVSRAPLSHLPGSSSSSTSLATTYRQDVSVVQSFNSNAGERNRHAYTPFSFQYLFHGVAYIQEQAFTQALLLQRKKVAF